MRGRFHARQMRAGRHPLVVGLERQSKPVVGNAHVAVRAARYRFRHHGLHLLRHHPDIGGVAAVVDEAIIAEAVVEPPEQHDIVLEAHVGATPAAATPPPPRPPPPTATAAAEAATAAPAAAEAAAAPTAEAAARHSTAAHRAAIGEGRVGPAHSHAAHRRASRPADVRPPSRTASGPRRRAGAAAGSACTAWTACAANSAGPACAANAAGPACAANSAWAASAADAANSAGPAWHRRRRLDGLRRQSRRPANPAGTACAANPAWPADPANAAGTACAADAARPPGSAGAAGAIGANSRLAAHAGPIVPVRPPGLHVIADLPRLTLLPILTLPLLTPPCQPE